jgi:hypothetical protein
MMTTLFKRQQQQQKINNKGKKKNPAKQAFCQKRTVHAHHARARINPLVYKPTTGHRK